MLGWLDRYRGIIGRGNRARWIAVIALALLVSGLEAISAVLVYSLVGLATSPTDPIDLPLVGDVRDLAPGVSNAQLVTWTAAAIAAFFLIRGLIVVYQSYFEARVANRTATGLSTRLLGQYLRLPYAFHLRKNSSQLIRNANEAVNEILATVLMPAVRLFGEAAVITGLLGVLLVTAPLATLIAAVTLVPLVLLLLWGIQPRIGRLGAISQEESGRSIKILQQSLHGYRDITVLGRQEYFLSEYHATRQRIARTRYLRALLGAIPRVSIEAAVVSLVAVFLILSTRTGPGAQGSLPVVGMFGYAALRIMPALNKVVANINSLRFGRAALDDVQKDLRRPTPRTLGDRGTRLAFSHQIRFENVAFTYEATDQPTLEDIDLAIDRGESVGIVGVTGAGKSTFIDLLVGLSAPTTGRIRIDDVDLRGNEPAWQQNIGLVSQQVFLLDDTLRANIAIGVEAEAIDDEQVERVLALAQLSDFVSTLPAGLETWVGERGVRVSGGQRQRIAIARALYRDPSVVVLDEGTASLDNVTEAAIIEAVNDFRGTRTLITVAHRLSTVRDCDRIVLLEQGRIVDVGSYDDLEAHSPAFRRLARVSSLS